MNAQGVSRAPEPPACAAQQSVIPNGRRCKKLKHSSLSRGRRCQQLKHSLICKGRGCKKLKHSSLSRGRRCQKLKHSSFSKQPGYHSRFSSIATTPGSFILKRTQQNQSKKLKIQHSQFLGFTMQGVFCGLHSRAVGGCDVPPVLLRS